MPSYVISGASRGIGLSLVDVLSRDKSNTVVGLVRDLSKVPKVTAGPIVARENVHWVKAVMEDRQSLEAAAVEVSPLVNGKLDVLIANAAVMPEYSSLDGFTELAKDDPAQLEKDMWDAFRVNVVGQVFLITSFLPLVKAGSLKKVVGISTGLADFDLTLDHAVFEAGPYSVSKAAFNMVLARFQAEHKDEGILFFALSPGLVATGHGPSPDMGEKAIRMGGKLAAYGGESFKGTITADESATACLSVIEKATLEKNAGKMVSHFGTTRWL